MMHGSTFNETNILALLQAVGESDGTYKDIVEIAQLEYGGQATAGAFGNWMVRGKKDLAAGKDSSFARLAKRVVPMIEERRGLEPGRCRVVAKAFAKFDRMCECGADRALDSAGKLLKTCRGCADAELVRVRDGQAR